MHPTRERGPFGPLFILSLAALLAAAPARAAGPDDIVPGQRLVGELEPSQTLRLPVRGIAGATLSLRLQAGRRSRDLRPVIRLEDPDGESVDLTGFVHTSPRGTRVLLTRLPVAKSGTYVLIITDAGGTAGAFRLWTRARTPTRFAGTVSVVDPGDDVTIPCAAHARDRVRLRLTPVEGSALLPWIRAFVAASGTETAVDAARRSRFFVVDAEGASFDVTGAEGSTGEVGYRVRVRRARAPRRVARTDVHALDGRDLVEDRAVYDVPGSDVIPMYVTIRPADNLPEDEDDDCEFIDTEDELGTTLADVHKDVNPHDKCKPEVNVVLQIAGIPDSAGSVNAELRLRGKSTRQAAQKSYRVKLKSKAQDDLWRGQRVFNLNKHPYDLTRFRNKLSFDMFSQLPGMTSLRTQFVRLYVDQEDGNGFVDFGLYTHVEKVDDYFLASHGLDPEATIYKAEFFEFYRYEDELRLESDPEYDESLFETILEIEEGGDDHAPLLAMLDAVNDEERDFETSFNAFFNEQNYLTWLASQVLMGNTDTDSQNFFLYRPDASTTFYFMPWDYDAAWDFYGQPNEAVGPPRLSRWRSGISNWWGVVLHRRFLKQPGAVERITAKMDELRAAYLTEAQIEARIDSYDVVRAPVFGAPDREHLPVLDESSEPAAQAEYDAEAARIPGVIEQNYQEYLDTLERPMPVYMAASVGASDVVFTWDESFDLQGDGLTYDFEVSTTPGFEPESLVSQDLGLADTTRLVVPRTELPAGTYYYRVIIRDDSNPAEHWQVAFDTYWDEVAERLYHGVAQLVIE